MLSCIRRYAFTVSRGTNKHRIILHDYSTQINLRYAIIRCITSKSIVSLSIASFVGVSSDLRMALDSHFYLVCKRIVYSQELVFHKFGLHNITVCYLIDWGNTMIAIVQRTTGVDGYSTVNIYYFSDTRRSSVCSFPFGHSPNTTSRYKTSILYWVCFLDLKRTTLV